MAIGYTFRLELEGETPTDPPTFRSATLNWNVGDTILLGRDGTLGVLDVQPGSDPDDVPVLVVRAA